jgi:hypothetical protein
MPSDPDWNTPAHMDGLPVRHWKRRTGFTERGTVAQMVQRWLGLAWHQQQECTLGWGPDGDGKHGHLSGSGIGSYVLRHGLPPAMAAARTRPATPEEIEAMFTKPIWREGPSLGPGHSIP